MNTKLIVMISAVALPVVFLSGTGSASAKSAQDYISNYIKTDEGSIVIKNNNSTTIEDDDTIIIKNNDTTDISVSSSSSSSAAAASDGGSAAASGSSSASGSTSTGSNGTNNTSSSSSSSAAAAAGKDAHAVAQAGPVKAEARAGEAVAMAKPGFIGELPSTGATSAALPAVLSGLAVVSGIALKQKKLLAILGR